MEKSSDVDAWSRSLQSSQPTGDAVAVYSVIHGRWLDPILSHVIEPYFNDVPRPNVEPVRVRADGGKPDYPVLDSCLGPLELCTRTSYLRRYVHYSPVLYRYKYIVWHRRCRLLCPLAHPACEAMTARNLKRHSYTRFRSREIRAALSRGR